MVFVNVCACCTASHPAIICELDTVPANSYIMKGCVHDSFQSQCQLECNVFIVNLYSYNSMVTIRRALQTIACVSSVACSL